MSMVCPQCKAAYEQRLLCPSCSTRLVFVEHSAPEGRMRLSSGKWQQTPWGRILIGLLLSQGLFYAGRHLCVAGLLVSESFDKELIWGTLPGQILLQVLQLLSLILGALFAGAGQRNGIIYGTVLGVWNGAFLVLVQPQLLHTEETQFYTTVTLYGQPLLQAAFGALAGFLGSKIWRPITPATTPETNRRPKAPLLPRLNLFAGPITITRVIMGVALGVGGTLWADVLLEQVMRASSYQLTPGSTLQAQLITWEIMVLAILAGGALAGATTFNGFKQGLAVGFGISMLLVGIRLGHGTLPSVVVLLASAFGPIVLAPLGGAFGSQLLPPLHPIRRRSFDSA